MHSTVLEFAIPTGPSDLIFLCCQTSISETSDQCCSHAHTYAVALSTFLPELVRLPPKTLRVQSVCCRTMHYAHARILCNMLPNSPGSLIRCLPGSFAIMPWKAASMSSLLNCTFLFFCVVFAAKAAYVCDFHTGLPFSSPLVPNIGNSSFWTSADNLEPLVCARCFIRDSKYSMDALDRA